jgi:hypothetical protein
MALGTITKVKRNGRPIDYVKGNKFAVVADVQCTSGANYTTGGETITAAAVGLKSIDYANILNQPATSTGANHRVGTIVYSAAGAGGQTSVKLAIGGAAAGAEVASNTDLSTYSTRIEFVGPRKA